MLKSIRISNFAVIHEVLLEFGLGLNVLTGETGSGKSLVMRALNLLLGERASAGQLRTGEQTAVVEGSFEPGDEEAVMLQAVLASVGIEAAESEPLTVRREFKASGKSRITVNDMSLTAADLRSAQPFLIEFYGQGDQRSLLGSRSQLSLLDGFADCASHRRKVRALFEQWKSLSREVAELDQQRELRERDLSLLRYQLQEIDLIRPTPGEDVDLSAERTLLVHAEERSRLAAEAYEALYERDDSILTRLSGVEKDLIALSGIDPSLRAQCESIGTAKLSLEDIAQDLRRYSTGIDFSRERLEEVEKRLTDLEDLKRKHRKDIDEILVMREQIVAGIARLEDLDSRGHSSAAALQETIQDYCRAAEKLSNRRARAIPEFEKRVTADLQYVALENARFSVRHRRLTREDTDYFSETGSDEIDFLFSANPGEALRPLSDVVSGGELSRLMLTLTTITNRFQKSEGSPVTLIFDEVDAGIGGRAALAVGQRLRELAASRQVLCVTHHPQIACFADHHFRVSKDVEGGRTHTRVEPLAREGRIRELARMIGGTKESKAARDAARSMLDGAASGAQA